MQIDIFVLLAQLVNFALLYYVFKKFIADKLLVRLEEREEQLKKLEKADEHYQEKMQLAEKERQEMLDNAKKTSRKLVKESEELAKTKAEKITKKAHDDAMLVLEGWRREIEKERKTMLTQMKSHILDTSLRLNEKLFGNWKTSKEFLEAELKKMK